MNYFLNICNALSLCALTLDCNVAHLQRLSDKQTLKEGDHHWDKPANRAVFPVRQPVHHGEISRHTAGCDHQYPANKHKPPRQPSLAALLFGGVSIDALFWTGAAVQLVSFQAGWGEPVLQETFHSLNLLHGSVVAARVRKTRRSQQAQLLLNVTQLPVEVPAVVALLLSFIWSPLRAPPHTVFCPCEENSNHQEILQDYSFSIIYIFQLY